jgi:predicted AlkP superfamily phosphohydrolase/phosphomutase
LRQNRTVGILLLALALAESAAAAGPSKKVLVLGVDGLDPKLLQRYMDEGLLPGFRALIERGDFKPLQTSMPPLSPIAWSNFITGMDPGGHGVFDFVHRDPQTMLPYYSMSEARPPTRTLPFGCWEVPLVGGGMENLRKGRAFWDVLEEHGVSTTIFRIPANFPPAETGGKALSGMGTPDIRGTMGTFSYYTDRPVPNEKTLSGGKVYRIEVVDGVVRANLYGPKNGMRKDTPECRRDGEKEGLPAAFEVHLDPDRPAARFVVQDEEFILQEGEWSDWVRVEFEAVPLLATVSAVGRFYLKQVRPDFRLYVSPLQINPADPGGMHISTPHGWSRDLVDELGYFYTQELPADTKALSGGILSGHEFWDQSQFVYDESRRALDHLLEGFEEGLLFFYFSSVDQGSHMLWRYADPRHPAHAEDELLERGIRTLYAEIDEVVGRVLASIDDDTTFIVMSDHGFGPFYRQVNLNTWLLEQGYVKLKDPSRQGEQDFFLEVDWSGTRAYSVGLNGVYVNLRGREKHGIVNPGAEHEALVDRLERELLALEDPQDGADAVTLVVRPQRDFHGPHRDLGPDIIVGYNWGYRTSWSSPLGKFPRGVFADNDAEWSGDHSIDHRLVPGVLIANRPITLEQPALHDLTVAILDEYGVEKPPEMIGRDCLGAAGSGPAPVAARED